MTKHLHHQPLAFLISVIISSLKWTFNPHPSFLCPLVHITLFIMFPFHSINTFSHLRLILCQFFFNTTSSSLSSLLSPINQSLFPSSANSSSPFFLPLLHTPPHHSFLYSASILPSSLFQCFHLSIKPESLSNYFPSFVTPSTSLHPSQPPCIISVSSVLRSNPFSSLHLFNHLSCHPSIMTLCSPGDQRL